ncbi:mediator of RNA polymerase II transcription subunit 1-like [Ischnura elegans]|uniref:mediator of RNA polymerase II transcription subunit 1-like n=1 Tax=Ischnura elegans TaxID=197161 RepID=UPI001ED8B759|nr:mediator of RNA polymerase II transcription subunit 1-like [Ischnura elegans]
MASTFSSKVAVEGPGIQKPTGPGPGDKAKEWQMELLMEKLRSKAGQFKSFAENAKAVRMALLEKRYPLDTVERSQMQKCLDTLQHSIKVTTLQAMVERLESVTRQLGLKFMAGPSGVDWFISSDMFYLEVVLEPSGVVKDVKIHHEGKVEQQSCEELVDCLSRGDFADFSQQLEGLASIYQLNAEKKVKCKAFLALQSLEKDLGTLAQLQTFIKEPFNLVHKSPVGILEKRRGGHALKLTYFVSPYDLLDMESKSSIPLTVENVISENLGHSVTVCIESSTSHKLQTAPLITVNRSPNGKSSPSYATLTAANSATLPACFVLHLKQPLPMCTTLARRIQQITEMECGDLSSPHPLLSLIARHSSDGQLDCANNRGLFVTLPDQYHCYFMTENRNLQGIMVNSIPFLHPAHIPQILVFLRQQVLFNVLVASCIRPFSKQELDNVIIFEVTALSWQHLSISFEHPLEESMATAELDLTDLSCVKCKLYSTASDNTLATAEYASKVVQRCLSIPITMRALIRKWQGQNFKTVQTNGNFGVAIGNFSMSALGDASQNNKLSGDFDGKITPKTEQNGTSHDQLGSVMNQNILSQVCIVGSESAELSTMAASSRSEAYPPFQSPVQNTVSGNLQAPLENTQPGMLNPLGVGALPTGLNQAAGQQKSPPVLLTLLNDQHVATQKPKKRKRKGNSCENLTGIWSSRSPKRRVTAAGEEYDTPSPDAIATSGESTPIGTPTTTVAPSDLGHHGGDSSSSSSSSSSISSYSKSDEFVEGGSGAGRGGMEVPAANATPPVIPMVDFTEPKDDPYDYEEEAPVQTQSESHDLEVNPDIHEVKVSSIIPPVHNVERHREKKKKSSSSMSSRIDGRKESKSTDGQTPQTIILDLAESNKSMVAPSVSITPITSSSIMTSPSLSSVLTGMGLERRPGIEIIPIVTSAATTLPSSITITPISSKSSSSSSEDRSSGSRDRRDDTTRTSKVKEGKRMMSSSPHPPGSGDDDGKRAEKKRKRRREESLSPIDGGKQSKVPTVRLEVMGPPQIPGKSVEKSLNKQEVASSKSISSSLGLKSGNPSSGSPPLQSSGMRKFSSSPTHSTSVKPISLMKGGASSPLSSQGLIKPKTSQSPKHSSSNPGSSPLYNTGSPKHSSSVSPKHAGLSPKQSGSGKPSMSALKSASANLSKSGSSGNSSSGDVLLKFGKSKEKDKDRKVVSSSSNMSSGHQSPKLKASTVKLKQLDFSQSSDLVQSVSKMMASSNSQGCLTSNPSSVSSNNPSSSSMSDKSPTASCEKMASAPSKQQQIRNRKGSSLSAVIDKLKSDKLMGSYGDGIICGDIKKESSAERSKEKKDTMSSTTSQKTTENKSREPGKSIADGKNPEYMVKPSLDGMKLTINKTRTKDSSARMSSGIKCGSLSSSPKSVTHTGLKPGVNSGPASKKPQQKVALGSSKSYGAASTPTSSGKSCSLKSSSSGVGVSKISKSSNSPKQSSPGDTRRDKVRPKEKISSPFGSKSSEQRKSSPASLRDDRLEGGMTVVDGGDRGSGTFKSLAGNASLSSSHSKVDPILPLEGLKLDPKFQIPKLSRNISNDPTRLGDSVDGSKRSGNEREKLESARHDLVKRESSATELASGMKFSKAEDKQTGSEKNSKPVVATPSEHSSLTSSVSSIPPTSSPSCLSPKLPSSHLQSSGTASVVSGGLDVSDVQPSVTHMESVESAEGKAETHRTTPKAIDDSVKHISELVTSLDNLNQTSKTHVEGIPTHTPKPVLPSETVADDKVMQLPIVPMGPNMEVSKPLIVPKTMQQSPPPMPSILQQHDPLENLMDTSDVRAKTESKLDIKVMVPPPIRGDSVSSASMMQPQPPVVPLPPPMSSPPMAAPSIPAHPLPPPPPLPPMAITSISAPPQAVLPSAAPPMPFPASPSVSVHIVKSPAPVASPLRSPLVIPSPHSTVSQASPCITDDELMDEALVGLGK